MDRRLDRLRAWMGDVQVFESGESRRRFLLHLAIAVALVLVASILVRRYLWFLTDASRVRALVREAGPLGPLVVIALQAAQVVLAPIPGQILAVAAGYLFGTWLGTLYNLVGVTIGSTAAFWLSRRFGRGYVEGIVTEDALATFDAVGEEYARPALLVLFLIPGLPDDVLCFAGGLTSVPLWQLVVIAVIGRAPGFFLANVVGDFLGTGRFVAAVVLAVVVLLASALGFYFRERIVRLFGGGNRE